MDLLRVLIRLNRILICSSWSRMEVVEVEVIETFSCRKAPRPQGLPELVAL